MKKNKFVTECIVMIDAALVFILLVYASAIIDGFDTLGEGIAALWHDRSAVLVAIGAWFLVQAAAWALSKRKEPVKIVLDMDGTLCEFRKAASYSDLFRKGYWITMKPHKNVVAAAKILDSLSYILNIRVMIATCTLNERAAREKKMWLAKQMPFFRKWQLIIIPDGYGEVKEKFIPGFRPGDVLLEDRTLNLKGWSGKGVKLLNGVNDTNGSWQGKRISKDDSSIRIAWELLKTAKGIA